MTAAAWFVHVQQRGRCAVAGAIIQMLSHEPTTGKFTGTFALLVFLG